MEFSKKKLWEWVMVIKDIGCQLISKSDGDYLVDTSVTNRVNPLRVQNS